MNDIEKTNFVFSYNVLEWKIVRYYFTKFILESPSRDACDENFCKISEKSFGLARNHTLYIVESRMSESEDVSR